VAADATTAVRGSSARHPPAGALTAESRGAVGLARARQTPRSPTCPGSAAPTFVGDVRACNRAVTPSR
jgi:hypothetical protein